MNQEEVPNYWSGHCFGCSKENEHGLQLRFWLSERGCYTKCSVPEHMCGMDGIVHGGIVAFLLDEVAEWAFIDRLNHLAATQEMTVRYLEPVRTNTEIVVESQIVSHDKKSALLKSSVRSTDGILMAESESKWALPKLSNMAKMAGIDESYLQQFLDKYSRYRDRN